jgi:hypothetical protein
MSLYVGRYHFDGDPEQLVPAYDLLLAGLGVDNFDLHVCVKHEAGLTAFDACPSQSVFEGFSRSPEFQAAVAAAGLPQPRAEGLGDVHFAHLRQAVGA